MEVIPQCFQSITLYLTVNDTTLVFDFLKKSSVWCSDTKVHVVIIVMWPRGQGRGLGELLNAVEQ